MSPMEVTVCRMMDKCHSKALRTAHRWEAGQELIAIDVGDGDLKKLKPFQKEQL